MGKEMTCKGNEYPGIATKSKGKAENCIEMEKQRTV